MAGFLAGSSFVLVDIVASPRAPAIGKILAKLDELASERDQLADQGRVICVSFRPSRSALPVLERVPQREPLRPSERGKDQIGFGGKRKNWFA